MVEVPVSTPSVPDWKQIREKAGPFPAQAYQFVRDGLQHTVKTIHGQQGDMGGDSGGDAEESRHVSGQQLCLGLKDYALQQYGLMARTVLSHWNVRKTEDFGRMVFAMVEAGLMRKTDDDTLEDFTGVFEFDQAFGTLKPDAAKRC